MKFKKEVLLIFCPHVRGSWTTWHKEPSNDSRVVWNVAVPSSCFARQDVLSTYRLAASFRRRQLGENSLILNKNEGHIKDPVGYDIQRHEDQAHFRLLEPCEKLKNTIQDLEAFRTHSDGLGLGRCFQKTPVPCSSDRDTVLCTCRLAREGRAGDKAHRMAVTI